MKSTFPFDRTRPRPYDNGPGWIVLPLTSGFTAVISREDASWVTQHKWHAQKDSTFDQVYAYRTVTNGHHFSKTKIYLHRAVANFPLGLIVDHWNGDGLDCRKINLRSLPYGHNSQAGNGHRGLRGVDRFNGRWRSRIQHCGLRKTIGYFTTMEEATAAYDREALRLYGKLALTNAKLGEGPPAFAFTIQEEIPF